MGTLPSFFFCTLSPFCNVYSYQRFLETEHWSLRCHCCPLYSGGSYTFLVLSSISLVHASKFSEEKYAAVQAQHPKQWSDLVVGVWQLLSSGNHFCFSTRSKIFHAVRYMLLECTQAVWREGSVLLLHEASFVSMSGSVSMTRWLLYHVTVFSWSKTTTMPEIGGPTAPR